MGAQESLLAEISTLKAQLAREREKNARLEHNVDVLQRMLFGPRSEKGRDSEPSEPGQGVLAFGDLAAAAERAAKERGESVRVEVTSSGTTRGKKARRSQFPGHLPVVRTTYRLEEEDRKCPCGGHLEEMGEEVTKELERVELSIVHEIARVKYACPKCRENVATAKGPLRVIDKGILGVGFLAHVLSERFVQHMPYHRQEKKYGAEGLSISRSVLCTSAGRCAELLEPVYGQMKREVLASPIVGTDDTPVTIQEGSNGKSGRAHLWVYRDPEGRCVFDFTESRSRDGPEKLLKGFKGYLQADAYSAYDAFFLPGGATEVGCWAHARRKFVEARASDPSLADEAVERIARLYAVEKKAKDLDAEKRQALRASESRPLLDDVFDWMGRVRPTVLDRGPIGEAIDYAMKIRVALSRYLDDGRLSIDNNAVERALRCVAIGRKNWMFVGNEEGGRRAAILFSLVQTCREIGVDPKEYFRDVLLRISTCSDAAKLTPHGWKRHFQAEVYADRRRAIERILVEAR